MTLNEMKNTIKQLEFELGIKDFEIWDMTSNTEIIEYSSIKDFYLLVDTQKYGDRNVFGLDLFVKDKSVSINLD